ncbi:hypothetical protein ACRQ5Q_07295 [Bradyrhizobium sp. PMVTL-01]|uniref:hypothetical protein n=1 Tax=Bradyrhizobium sp. PMVTL-01 TaxID=3434999 RepID=UPI003F72AE60
MAYLQKQLARQRKALGERVSRAEREITKDRDHWRDRADILEPALIGPSFD